MSVNRVFGYDVTDPAQESYNLNVAASQGSGSTYKVFTAAAALARQYSQYYTLTTSDPYVSRVYRDGTEPYDVRNAGRYRATLDLSTALYQSSNTYFLGPGGRPGQRRGAGADGRGGRAVPVQPTRAGPAGDRREPRVVHLRRRGDQPARPGQRVLHLRRQRHPLPGHPGDRRAGPGRPAAARRRRPAAGARGPVHARGDRRPGWPPRSTRSCAGTSSRGTPARPGRGPTSPGTRSPARPGRRRTTSPPPSSAPPPRSPPA